MVLEPTSSTFSPTRVTAGLRSLYTSSLSALILCCQVPFSSLSSLRSGLVSYLVVSSFFVSSHLTFTPPASVHRRSVSLSRTSTILQRHALKTLRVIRPVFRCNDRFHHFIIIADIAVIMRFLVIRDYRVAPLDPLWRSHSVLENVCPFLGKLSRPLRDNDPVARALRIILCVTPEDLDQ